jgi:hypothetical protein
MKHPGATNVAKAASSRKKAAERRVWSKDDIRVLKSMARKESLSNIARSLKRSEGATRHKATLMGVSLAMNTKKRAAAKKR